MSAAAVAPARVKAKMAYQAVSLMLPAATALLTYFVVNPVMEKDEKLKGCSKRGELSRSTKSFLWSATAASFASLALSGVVTAGVDVLIPKYENKDVLTKRLYWTVLGMKVALLVSALVSGSVAAAAYSRCLREAEDEDPPKRK